MCLYSNKFISILWHSVPTKKCSKHLLISSNAQNPVNLEISNFVQLDKDSTNMKNKGKAKP